MLRPGKVHSADGWEEFLEPIVKRYREMDKKLYLSVSVSDKSLLNDGLKSPLHCSGE